MSLKRLALHVAVVRAVVFPMGLSAPFCKLPT
jgi:hypothetical protein